MKDKEAIVEIGSLVLIVSIGVAMLFMYNNYNNSNVNKYADTLDKVSQERGLDYE